MGELKEPSSIYSGNPAHSMLKRSRESFIAFSLDKTRMGRYNLNERFIHLVVAIVACDRYRVEERLMAKRIGAENRIKDITRAAIVVFRQKGFRQAQMADIAKEAGLSPGGLYTYFESKSHLFVYVMINGAPENGGPMPTPESASARTEEELVEIFERYLKERAQLASVNRFLETEAKDVDLAAEIAAIFEEWWDLMEEHNVQIAIIEKSAAEFLEMAEIYDKYGRRYLVEQVEEYLSLRIRQGVIRELNSIGGMARAIMESLSWFAWKQFAREPVPLYRKADVLPDLILTSVRGLEASSRINERKQS